MSEANDKKTAEDLILNMNKEKEETLKKLNDYLENMVDITYQIHDICYRKLREAYEGEEITLPIKIEMIADKMGVQIEYGNVDFGMKNKIDHEIAQLRLERDGDATALKVIVDNTFTHKQDGDLSNLEKYAIAYELGKIIINEPDKEAITNIYEFNMESMPYSLPRLPARLENFKYEMCAIFLLLPLELFFKVFKKYLAEIQEQPILMDNWFLNLSQKTNIPTYQLINGYQYIKFCAYQYYQEKLSDGDIDNNEYLELFN